MHLSKILILFALITLNACGSKKQGEFPFVDPAENPLDPSFNLEFASTRDLDIFYANATYDPNKTTVLVFDHGFDPRHTAFSDKIIASYTMSCDLVGEKASDFNFNRPYEQIKAEAIEYYINPPRDECHLEAGFRPKAINALDNLPADVKTRFNNAVLSKQLRTDLRDELGFSAWCENTVPLSNDVLQLCDHLTRLNNVPIVLHGTSTAGIIAYNNPNVQLVLVDSEEVVNQDFVLAKDADIPCLSDRKVNHLIQLYQDHDFIDAFLNSPSKFKETLVSSLYGKHEVQFENRSFMLRPYNQIRLSLKMKSCLNENLKELWTLATKLEQQRFVRSRLAFASTQMRPILFQGAGHFRTEANSIEDFPNCMFGQAGVYTVGYDYINDISNYGKCVDVHYYGSSLIVPFGSNLFFNTSGSSFSTPFLLRQFTVNGTDIATVELELGKYKNTFYPLTEDAKSFIFSEH